MALSDSARLAVLQTERDELEALLGTGVSRYRIGNREVDRSGAIQWLEYLNKTIGSLQAAVNGSNRNYARVMRHT